MLPFFLSFNDDILTKMTMVTGIEGKGRRTRETRAGGLEMRPPGMFFCFVLFFFFFFSFKFLLFFYSTNTY